MKGYILLLTSFLAMSVAAQRVVLKSDKQKILIGEQFNLRLQANFYKDEALDFFDIDTFPGFEVLKKSQIDTSQFNEGVALIQNFTLTSWDSGKLQIAPFILGRYKTKPVIIEVGYSPHPFDTTQPYHDIHDLMEAKRPSASSWYWYLIGVLIVALLFLLFFPRGKARNSGEFVSDEGAYKRALKKLDLLRKKPAPDNKLFYTELVQILREYLHKRKNVYSFSKTTEDLSAQIEKLNIDKDQYQQLIQTLVLSDFVKYAKYQSTEEERTNSLESVRESIAVIENSHVPNTKLQTSVS